MTTNTAKSFEFLGYQLREVCRHYVNEAPNSSYDPRMHAWVVYESTDDGKKVFFVGAEQAVMRSLQEIDGKTLERYKAKASEQQEQAKRLVGILTSQDIKTVEQCFASGFRCLKHFNETDLVLFQELLETPFLRKEVIERKPYSLVCKITAHCI